MAHLERFGAYWRRAGLGLEQARKHHDSSVCAKLLCPFCSLQHTHCMANEALGASLIRCSWKALLAVWNISKILLMFICKHSGPAPIKMVPGRCLREYKLMLAGHRMYLQQRVSHHQHL